MDLEIRCEIATIERGSRGIIINAGQVSNNTDILDEMGVGEVIAYFGQNDLLDEIGEKAAKDYFNLIDAKDSD